MTSHSEQVPSKKLDIAAIKARNAEDLAVLDRDPTLPEQFDVWIAPADIRDMLAEIERLQRANADLLRRNLVLSTSPESRTYADTAGTYADSAHEPQLAASNELARRIQGLLDDYGDCPVGQLAIDEHFLREIIAALEATHEPPAVPVFERPKHYGDPIKPVWSYRGQHSLYKSEAWERYAKDVELERDAALRGSHPSTAQPPPAGPVAPIVNVHVKNGEIVSHNWFTPGLPDGRHDLFPVPPDPRGQWEPWPTPPPADWNRKALRHANQDISRLERELRDANEELKWRREAERTAQPPPLDLQDAIDALDCAKDCLTVGAMRTRVIDALLTLGKLVPASRPTKGPEHG